MKTNHLHIFEILQRLQDSPADQSLQTQMDEHLAECTQCRDYQAIMHQMIDSEDLTSIDPNGQRLSDSQLVSNIRKRIQHQRFLPGLLRPLPDLAWISLVVVLVLLLSWGINTLRTGPVTAPASSIIVPQPSPTPTQVIPVSQTCRPIAYTVKEKDTLLAISAYFNVPVDILYRENDLGNDYVLKPGRSIFIPFCGWYPAIELPDIDEVTPIENCPLVVYTIQQGDTVEDISAFFGVPGIIIVSDNQLVDNPVLTPEATLVIRICRIL